MIPDNGEVTDVKSRVHEGKICGMTWVDDNYILTTGLEGFCVSSNSCIKMIMTQFHKNLPTVEKF